MSMINQELTALRKSLAFGKITKEEYGKCAFGSQVPSKEDCLRLLKSGLENRDPGIVEDGLFLVSVIGLNSEFFAETFCALLKEDWHYSHEVIAMDLEAIQSTTTVECLYYAATLKFRYLDYDDTYQFARKCIKALSAIGDERAVQFLRLLSEGNNPVIVGYAKKELNYKGLT